MRKTCQMSAMAKYRTTLELLTLKLRENGFAGIGPVLGSTRTGFILTLTLYRTDCRVVAQRIFDGVLKYHA